MLNCWDENSTNRASFTDLRKQFDSMLSSMASKVSVVFFYLQTMQCHFIGGLVAYLPPACHVVQSLPKLSVGLCKLPFSFLWKLVRIHSSTQAHFHYIHNRNDSVI